MASLITERVKVIDSDTHISEPEDVWTSRVSKQRWGDLVPHVVPDPEGGPDRVWMFAGEKAWGVAMVAITGHKEYFPSHPPTLEKAHPGAYNAQARLRYMDEEGVYAQVVFPNVGGFGSGRFLKLKEPELMLSCVQAYNDFLVEWASADPNRLLPIAAMPFWDVEACAKEVERCARIGHKGVLWCGHTESYGFPHLADPHWEPVWSAAEDAGLSINFHIAASGEEERMQFWPGYDGTVATRLTRACVNFLLDNSNHVADTILSGMCHRHPKLKVVAVESGAGWVPFVLDLLDWNWANQAAWREHPDRLLPSEYFRRQVYSMFYFERPSTLQVLEAYPDNFLYETDFPHPISMSPSGTGDPRVGGHPKDYIERTLGGLPDELVRKVLHDNAAKVYNVTGN